MTTGRGLQILGGLLGFGAASSFMVGSTDGVQYFGNAAAVVIGLVLIWWGGRLHHKQR
jgi:membrane associated rhomboid family serine protease